MGSEAGAGVSPGRVLVRLAILYAATPRLTQGEGVKALAPVAAQVVSAFPPCGGAMRVEVQHWWRAARKGRAPAHR